MGRLPRGALLSHRSAGGEGGAVRHQRGESHRRWLVIWVSCYMIQKANPVTLTLYSSPKGRYHHPKRRGRCRPPERSEHNLPPTGGHNPRGEAPSILTPKACPRVRSKNDTGRRLAVRIAMGCQIGALPCTPFASSRHSPQGETRSMERKNRESYISCTIPQYLP